MQLEDLSNLDLSGIPAREDDQDEYIGLFVARDVDKTKLGGEKGQALGDATRTYLESLASILEIEVSEIHVASSVVDLQTDSFAGITDDTGPEPTDG